MTQNDIVLVVLIVLCLVLLDYSGTRIWDSVSAETELTTEWNLLEAAGSDCQNGQGCESANWKLTLQSKKSDVAKALAAVRRDRWRAGEEVVLTLVGLVFILLRYPELRSVLRSRLGIKPRRYPETGTA